MDYESVEFKVANIIETDNYMADAVPARKMFSSRDTRGDGVNYTLDGKPANLKILKELAKLNLKKKKKTQS